MHQLTWGNLNTDTAISRRWVVILPISVLIHVIIIFNLNLISTPTKQETFSQGTPITVILEQAETVLEQQERDPGQETETELKIPIIKEDIVKPIDSDLEQLNLPVRTIDIPDPQTITVEESSSEQKQITAAELLALSKSYIKKEADKEVLLEERNRELWAVSPSIMFDASPDFFGKNEKLLPPDEQEQLAMLLETSMLKEQPFITPIEFKIGPLSCFTLFVILGCAW